MMKKGNKGQALVEFIIILPIILFLLLGFIDLGRIVLESNRLESVLSEVIHEGKGTTESDWQQIAGDLGYDDVVVTTAKKDNNLEIEMTKKVKIMTPGLKTVLGKNYYIKVERVIRYEE